MKASTGKTFGLIFVVLIILAAGARLTPLVVAPFGIFSSLNRAISSTVHGLGRYGVESVFGWALVVFWILVLFWVYRDAERRGMTGGLWALLVLIGNLIGLIIYLIVRNEGRSAQGPAAAPATSATSATTRPPFAAESTGSVQNPAAPESAGPPACPKCGKPADPKHAFCPFCGESLRPVCPRCGKPVESAWMACAHCGEKLKS
jgi:hypothetical protein